MSLRIKLPVVLWASAIVIASLSCGDSASAEGMIGSWNMTVKIDDQAAEKAMAAVEDETQKRVYEALLPAMKNMTGTLDVREDGTYTMSVEMSLFGAKQTNKEEGTWKLVKKEGKKIVVETTEKGKTKKDTHNITQIDKDHFLEAAPKEMGPLSSALQLEYHRKQ